MGQLFKVQESKVDRKLTVGASEVSALFGLNSYVTARELYHIKRGDIEQFENKQMTRGRILEPAIAELWMNESNRSLTLHGTQVICPKNKGFSATPDYLDDAGCPVEFKTTRFMKDTGGASDAHIIQLQGQMLCLDKPSGTIVYYDMVRDEFFSFEFKADPKIHTLILSAVDRFWAAVETETPPKVVAEDVDVLNRLFTETSDEKLDLSSDNFLSDILPKYDDAKARLSAVEKEVEGYKAEIKDKIKDAALAVCGDYHIKQTIVSVKEKVVKAHTQKRLTISNKKKGE